MKAIHLSRKAELDKQLEQGKISFLKYHLALLPLFDK